MTQLTVSSRKRYDYQLLVSGNPIVRGGFRHVKSAYDAAEVVLSYVPAEHRPALTLALIPKN